MYEAQRSETSVEKSHGLVVIRCFTKRRALPAINKYISRAAIDN